MCYLIVESQTGLNQYSHNQASAIVVIDEGFKMIREVLNKNGLELNVSVLIINDDLDAAVQAVQTCFI
ncbi:hypothetical protein DERF_005699 [Dermatophagoides farinae]|uniref:Uncharacterized protein n=1 Tax=Dermatophagoides farinae TaxID=6954 RepID=A0A922I7E4_DERFA|nr:hypothetical protein DERF_005699 [Dermatophagoides farinae]